MNPEENQPQVPQDPAQPAAPSSQSAEPSTPAPATAEPAQPSAPVAPATPPIDESAVTEKVTKTVIDKIAGALGITKPEEKAKIPTDPVELERFIKENARKGAEELLTEREQAAKAESEAYQRSVSEGATRFQNLWKDQYSQLAESGKVPKIVNGIDKNDPGMQVKSKLLMKLGQILKENQEKGIDYVPTLKEVFYEHGQEILNSQPAGATVPISGGGRSMSPNSGLSYEQMHNTDIEDLVKSKYQG